MKRIRNIPKKLQISDGNSVDKYQYISIFSDIDTYRYKKKYW